jgi:hypothetical protein
VGNAADQIHASHGFAVSGRVMGPNVPRAVLSESLALGYKYFTPAGGFQSEPRVSAEKIVFL